jgi:hypothetical protein
MSAGGVLLAVHADGSTSVDLDRRCEGTGSHYTTKLEIILSLHIEIKNLLTELIS